MEWIELNDIGIAATKEQHPLLDAYLYSILEMRRAHDVYRVHVQDCAHAALELIRSGIDPRALIAVTEIAEEM
jgi:hypothetical protein